MKTKLSKKVLSFGDLTKSLSNGSKRRGRGILRRLIKAELGGFRGRNGHVSGRGNGAA